MAHMNRKKSLAAALIPDVDTLASLHPELVPGLRDLPPAKSSDSPQSSAAAAPQAGGGSGGGGAPASELPKGGGGAVARRRSSVTGGAAAAPARRSSINATVDVGGAAFVPRSQAGSRDMNVVSYGAGVVASQMRPSSWRVPRARRCGGSRTSAATARGTGRTRWTSGSSRRRHGAR